MKKLLFMAIILLIFSCSETRTRTEMECKIGETRSCYTGAEGTNGVGVCKEGTQTCVSGGKWGQCEGEVLPSSELCDGIDNDCNGDVDDNIEIIPQADKTAGVCANSKKECKDGAWVEPDYTQIEGYEEVETKCDGLDNDCDGNADNGLIAPPADKIDGVCNTAVKLCMGVNGWQEPNYDSIEGYESPEVSCDGLDNNCDGEVDNIDVLPSADKNLGVCSGAKKVCKGSEGWSEPDYTQIDKYEEDEVSCDGEDNDCDGTVDEGCGCSPGQTQACGSNIGECSLGVQTCADNGQWGECEDQTLPSEEICDGLDNDCNGLADDNLTRPLADKQDGVCQGAKKVCEGTDGWVEPSYVLIENYETNETSCDGLDNDCDGTVDEGYNDNDEDGQADCVDIDDDNDGVLDSNDNCPFTANESQINSDDDELGDACDDDDDNDGVLDNEDNCPIVANEDQVDSDGDGTGDSCDECPHDVNKTEAGLCGCGVSDKDTDGDGVEDCHDNCVYTPNPDQANEDGDSKGDACDMCGEGTEPEEICNGIDDDCNGVVDEPGVCDENCTREEYNGHVYLFCNMNLNWMQAEAKCNSMGYNLVEINNSLENTWLRDKNVELFGDGSFYMGLNDIREEGQFKWNYKLENTIYTNWNQGEPNNSGGNEDCTEMREDGTWNDRNCQGEGRRFVCENNNVKYFSSCKDINDNGYYGGQGIYVIDIDGEAGEDPFPVFCLDDWTMVYKKSSGVMTYADQVFFSGNSNMYDESLLNLNKSDKDYANKIITNNWGSFSYAYIWLMKNGERKKFMIYNIHNTNNDNWYTYLNLINSSWTFRKEPGHVFPEYNFWSIPGAGDSGYRDFFINRNYGGCNVDRGWVVIIGDKRNCDWERFNSIKYSDVSDYAVWNSDQAKYADAFIIFVK